MGVQALCRYAEGTNSVTGVDTRKSLGEHLLCQCAPACEANIMLGNEYTGCGHVHAAAACGSPVLP